MDYIKELMLTGHDLTIEGLTMAARQPKIKVKLCQDSISSMHENRMFAEKCAARGDQVYGLTTGVGVRRTRSVEPNEMSAFNQRMVRDHATGQGPALPEDIARASAICLLNSLAAGRSNVRPEVAIHISKRLSQGKNGLKH